MPKQANRVPVSERALTQRINRKLPKFHVLKKCRGPRWRDTMGDFYIVDQHRNAVAETHVDLEKLGRSLGALAAFETLVD